MASPQVEDGYTPIANELLEAIIRGSFNRRELMVLLVVARATYGWRQKTTVVSKLELIRRSGLDPSDGYKTIRDLKGRNVLVEDKEGLGIQKNYELWQSCTRGKSPLGVNHPYQGQITPSRLGKSPLVTRGKTPLVSSRERPSGVALRAPKSISKSITKTNIADAPPVSAPKGGEKGSKIHQETDPCIRLFSEQFSRKFDRGYQVEWGRDRKLISGLLRGHGPEVVRELTSLFFRYAPQWVRDNGRYTIPVFRKTFNELQALKGQGEI